MDDDHVEKLCQSLSLSDLQSLNGQLEAGDPGADLIKAGIRSLDSAAAAEEERKEAARLAEIQVRLRGGGLHEFPAWGYRHTSRAVRQGLDYWYLGTP